MGSEEGGRKPADKIACWEVSDAQWLSMLDVLVNGPEVTTPEGYTSTAELSVEQWAPFIDDSGLDMLQKNLGSGGTLHA